MFNQFAQACYENSKAHGFWEDYPIGQLPLETVLAKLCLIHSEVSECLEAARIDDMGLHYRIDGKPEGFPSEIADILIRVGDLAARMGIDLDQAVAEKMAFNTTRPHKHGKLA